MAPQSTVLEMTPHVWKKAIHEGARPLSPLGGQS
jgi:hypothetical protein